MTGRPSDYTEEIAASICEQIAKGESVVKICTAEGMPSPASVYKWLAERQTFSENYARARERQADFYFEQMVDIATTPFIGETSEYDGNANLTKVTTKDMIEHRRLQIETLKWVSSKLRPKKYGDKLEVDANLKVALAPIINLGEKDAD